MTQAITYNRGEESADRQKALAWILATVMIWMSLSLTQVQAQDIQTSRYTYADLADKVMPSVVTVYVKTDLSKQMTPEEMERFRQLRPFFNFGPLPANPEEIDPEQFIQESAGSGVIISDDGYVLTNRHVVGQKEFESATKIVMWDDTEIAAEDVELVWSHELIDLAILKINRKDVKFHPIEWGKSADLRIGERVAAIGSPLDLRLSITQGIVCAKQRDIMTGRGDWGGHIQTDAVINPGSSGGPLVNLDGELIGINRIITTNDGRWQGYGFAIPADDVRFFAEQAMEKGTVDLGYIGVTMVGVEDDRQMARALKLPEGQRGVIVKYVHEGTPADEAKLEADDVIIAANGHPIKSPTGLLHFVARQEIGSSVELKVLRGNDRDQIVERDFKLKIARRDSERDLQARIRNSILGDGSQLEEKPKAEESFDDLGLRLGKSGRGLRIEAVKPGSPADKAGLEAGDLILELNRKELATERDYNEAIKRRDKGEIHLLTLERDGLEQTVYIEITP